MRRAQHPFFPPVEPPSCKKEATEAASKKRKKIAEKGKTKISTFFREETETEKSGQNRARERVQKKRERGEKAKQKSLSFFRRNTF